MTDPTAPDIGTDRADREGERVLPEAARRALAEAEMRRRALHEAEQLPAAPEHGGRGGLDPVRYEDWEIEGRAVDF